MSSINSVTMTGRLTRDPELRTTTTGKQVVGFGIAVEKRFKPQDPNEKDADFFNVTAWNQTAEFVANYASKGRMIGVQGRLQTRKYTNKDGVEVNTFEIVADNVVLLDRPRDDAGGQPAAVGAPAASTEPAEVSEGDYDPFGEE
ncbi:MAG: single-stranded DNA-binding protein [Armatimonadetes bacterium]|nr:single-stranded DNA-binding protein [Armatimonadota bacterium]